MAAPTRFALRRIPLKDLEPDLDNILIVAVIIGKRTPKKFPERGKENDQYRGVWGFTLRDSSRDYINVTCWGSSDEISAASEKFYTGDVVEITNPRVSVRKFNDSNDLYSPMVTSPFTLVLNDATQIMNYSGDVFAFTKLMNFPTKPLGGYVPLRDIHNGGDNMKDRTIDILGAVKTVGPTKNIVSKSGQELQIREIVLFDHTSPGLRVALWDTENILRATNWKPRTTVLFITDTKIVWSDFLNAYSASVTQRSIVTENPIGKEANALSNYALSAPLDDSEIVEKFISSLPDPESIQNVLCVQQVVNKIIGLSQQNSTMEPHVTALMYVAVTQLDLDGPLPLIRVKCSSCKGLLRNSPPACENMDCAAVTGVVTRELDTSFDIQVNLSDHTGTLANCRLSGKVAEQVLGVTVQQFLRMTDEEKCRLKWEYLMERCAVRIVVVLSNQFRPRISIMTCSKSNPLEAAQKIPLC